MPEDAPVPEDRQPALDATPGATYVWEPQRAVDGPVAILVSGADRRMYVYRNGVRIGETAVRISDPDTPLMPAVYGMLRPAGGVPTTPAAGPAGQRWMRVDLPAQAGAAQAGDFTQRVRVPKTFAANLAPLLVPGTTLMVTDRAATEDTRSAPGFVVMQASPPSS